jgi:hypothetical protein
VSLALEVDFFFLSLSPGPFFVVLLAIVTFLMLSCKGTKKNLNGIGA